MILGCGFLAKRRARAACCRGHRAADKEAEDNDDATAASDGAWSADVGDWQQPCSYDASLVDVHACMSLVCPLCQRAHGATAFVTTPRGLNPSQLRILPRDWWAADGAYDAQRLQAAIAETVASLRPTQQRRRARRAVAP